VSPVFEPEERNNPDNTVVLPVEVEVEESIAEVDMVDMLDIEVVLEERLDTPVEVEVVDMVVEVVRVEEGTVVGLAQAEDILYKVVEVVLEDTLLEVAPDVVAVEVALVVEMVVEYTLVGEVGDTLEDTTVGVDFGVVQAEDSYEEVADIAKLLEEAVAIEVDVVEHKD
jgi:hypothetical protein